MNKSFSEDPMFQQALAFAKSPVTRRTVLAGAGATSVAAFLAACAKPGGATPQGLTPATDVSATEKVMTWHDWTAYMDGEDDSSYPTLKAFTAKTGIAVNYDPYAVTSNTDYFNKWQNQLRAGQDTGADTMCLTDWMAARLISNGWVQRLDYANLPNVTANMDPAFNGAAGHFGNFDPDRQYSLPWRGIIAAIGYHKENYKKLTGKDAPTSLEDLWAPELKGKIEVLEEMRDTMGVAMMADGVDITKFTADDFYNALDKIKAQVTSKQIRNVKGQSYIEDFNDAGDAVAGIVWAGDLIAQNLASGSDKLGYVLLDSGSTFACDNFLIPMGATHATNAEKVMNYYFDPEVAAEVALAGVNYIPPVMGVRDLVGAKNPALLNNELMFPTADTYANKLHTFRNLTAAEEEEFSTAWSDVINGVG